MRNSDRAKAGFNKLAASIAPSVLPAPSTRCTSSTKRMIFPSAFLHSSNTAPPATKAPMSSVRSATSFRVNGTSPCNILFASPSMTAVFPTPGSPTKQALFLLRRHNIWIMRLISSSLPITGSNLPSSAAFTRSIPYFSNASYVSSAEVDVTFRPPRISSVADATIFLVKPTDSNTSLVDLSMSYRATSKWSNATKESPFDLAAAIAR
ncbi:hypothetical protein ACHAWC_011279 [Mediolabrus comicus]